MSFSKPVPYNKKQQKLNFVNLIVSAHDLCCGCTDPLKCSVDTICEQEPTIKQKCLTTTTGAIQHGEEEEEDGFGDGDLEALFAEDFGDDDSR